MGKFRKHDPANTSEATFGQRLYQGLATGGLKELSNAYDNMQTGNYNASVAGNNAWSSLGLDPSLYSGNVRNMKKGLEMSSADLQSALVSQQMAERSAQLEYDLSKKMYDETQSFQAQVNQMKEAGLNPALMYGSSIQSSGGADAPSVSAGTASNTGSAIEGRQAGADALLGAGGLAVDAFKQAMSIPIMKQEARGMTIKNDLDESMANYYKRRIIAESQDAENRARSSAVKAFIDESTKDNEVEISGLDVVAKKYGIETQELENFNKRLQNKMTEIDAEHKEQMVNLTISLQAQEIVLKQAQTAKEWKTVKLIEEQIRETRASAGKLLAETKLLDEDLSHYTQNQFLAYVDGFSKYVTAISAKASVGVAASAKGLGANASFAYSLVEDGVETAVRTMQDQFGLEGVYTSLHLNDSRDPEEEKPSPTPMYPYQPTFGEKY